MNHYGKEIFFKMNYGYPKIELWISLNQIIMDIQKKKKRIMDIQKSNYGYPKFKLIFGYPKTHLRISLNELI